MFEGLKKILGGGGKKPAAVAPDHVADEFVRHAMRGDTAFQMNLGGVGLEALFDAALEKEPRLIYQVMSFSTQNRGAYSDVKVGYRQKAAVRMEDLLVIDDSFTIDDMLRVLEKMPAEKWVVVNDLSKLEAYLGSLLGTEDLPQYSGYSFKAGPALKNSKGWAVAHVELTFDTKAVNEAGNRRLLQARLEEIVNLLRLTNLLPEVKVFLALSYMAQETEVDLNGGNSAYNALCEKKASAVGFAEGYAALLNHVGIPCRVQEGENNAIRGVVYAWNLVQLAGEWYHVDPAVTLQGNELYLGAFMCSDAVMSREYTWSSDEVAHGFFYDKDKVLSSVRAAARTLTAMGVPNKYVNPPIEK